MDAIEHPQGDAAVLHDGHAVQHEQEAPGRVCRPNELAGTLEAPLVELHGWGRSTPGVLAEERRSEDLEAITVGASLSRGLGRSYGDASLPAARGDAVANSTLANRLLAFDEETGLLRAEAGLSLFDLNRTLLPRCWFTPVSPGTQFVTLGGMVASDIHGKNHHRDGSFGDHVTRLRIRMADGAIQSCSRTENPELFLATIGGMGLTGHILEVEFHMQRVPSPWVWQESRRFRDPDALLAALEEAGPNWPFTVAWVDCATSATRFGRSFLHLGRWAEPSEAPTLPPHTRANASVPFDAPGWLLNRASIAVTNTAYYYVNSTNARIEHPERFFYPLDRIGHWNRLYGKRGFTQYQCVLPRDRPDSVRKFFELLASLGVTPALCVIKDFRREGIGLLSFPKPGFTIAVDFRVTSETQAQVTRLNDFVAGLDGRIYLAKDGFTGGDQYRQMEPRLRAWNDRRDALDPRRRIRSALSVRLFGDPLT